MSEKNMKLNMVMGLIDKITSPIRKVTKNVSNLSGKIEDNQAKLKKLGATTKDIEHFRKLKSQIDVSGRSLDEAKAKANRLAAELNNTTKPTRKLTAEFKRAQGEVKKLSASHQREQTELQQLRSRLTGAGVATSKLNEATRKIREQTKRYNQELEKNQQKLAETANKQKALAKIRDRNSQMRASASADVVGVGVAVYGLKRLVDAYGDVSTAQGQIKSLGISTEGIEAITKAGRDFSSQWAGTTTTDFITASYDIKSGISSLSDVAIGEFTKIAALTATGTKASVGTMTDLFATGYSIYREQFDQFGASVIKDWDKLSSADRDLEFGKYFSAGISSSVKMFKTDGDKISQYMQTLGASATQAKQSLAEQLAVGGMLSATFKGGQAATKYQQFLANAGKASEKLGIQVHNANGDLLSTGDILTAISDKYGGTLNDMAKQELKTAFGTKEAVDMIDMLLPKLNELKGKTVEMQGELTKGMSTTMEMADAIGHGPAESLQIVGQQLGNLAYSVGKLFSPALVAIGSVIGGFATGLDSFIQTFPLLSQIIAFAVVGLIAFKVASIAARFSFAFFSDTMITARKVMDFFTLANLRAKGALVASKVAAIANTTATIAMSAASKGAALATSLMSGAMTLFNLVITANPIGLLITAIVALAAWGLSLVDDWSPVTAFFSDLWDGVKSSFSGAWDLFTTLLSWTPLGLIISAWQPLTEFFGGLWDGIKGLASGFLDWIVDAVMSPISAIKDAFGDIMAWFSGDDNVTEVVQTVRNINDVANVNKVDAANDSEFSSEDPVFNQKAKSPEILQTGFRQSPAKASHVDQSQINLTIETSPGMDAQDVAREVEKVLAEHARKQSRRVRGFTSDAA